MSLLTLLLLLVSFAVLALGTYAWRLTSSRAIMLNTVFGTFALLMAASRAGQPGQAQAAVIVSFLVAMLFGGRAMGVWWRSRKQVDLRGPARLMTAIAALSLFAAISAYVAL